MLGNYTTWPAAEYRIFTLLQFCRFIVQAEAVVAADDACHNATNPVKHSNIANRFCPKNDTVISYIRDLKLYLHYERVIIGKYNNNNSIY